MVHRILISAFMLSMYSLHGMDQDEHYLDGRSGRSMRCTRYDEMHQFSDNTQHEQFLLDEHYNRVQEEAAQARDGRVRQAAHQNQMRQLLVQSIAQLTQPVRK